MRTSYVPVMHCEKMAVTDMLFIFNLYSEPSSLNNLNIKYILERSVCQDENRKRLQNGIYAVRIIVMSEKLRVAQGVTWVDYRFLFFFFSNFSCILFRFFVDQQRFVSYRYLLFVILAI
jgi:hypothetical protein